MSYKIEGESLSSKIKRSNWYDVETVATLLGLNPETVRRMIRRGEITAHYLGKGRLGGYRIDHDEVEQVARRLQPHMRLVFADDENGS